MLSTLIRKAARTLISSAANLVNASSLEELDRLIDSLPRDEHYPVPEFKDEWADITHVIKPKRPVHAIFGFKKHQLKLALKTELPASILEPCQTYVRREGLKEYLRKPPKELPLVVLHEGRYFLIDHTRTCAQILHGATKVKVRLLEHTGKFNYKTPNVVQAAAATASSGTLVVVDIQPAHYKHCNRVLGKAVQMMNDHSGRVFIVFNGEDLGMDSKSDVLEYFHDAGVDEDVLGRAKWIEKGYGFLRSWMDEGVSKSDIVSTIEQMLETKAYDSRDLDDLPEDVPKDDPIFLPEELVKAFTGVTSPTLIGGGKDECLAELSILLDGMGVKHHIDTKCVY